MANIHVNFRFKLKMGNANTHERRKSGGVPDTGPYIEDIRSHPADGEDRHRKGR